MIIPKNFNKNKKEYFRISKTFGNLSEFNQLQILRGIRENNVLLRITVFGKSMVPSIRNNDVIILTPLKEKKLEIGDIVAFESQLTKKPVIHRIINENNGNLLMKGDNCLYTDGEISIDRVLGLVSDIKRNGRSANFGISRVKVVLAWLSRMGILQKIVRDLNFDRKD